MSATPASWPRLLTYSGPRGVNYDQLAPKRSLTDGKAAVTVATVPQRLRSMGDLFRGVSSEAHRVDRRVDGVLTFVRRNGQ